MSTPEPAAMSTPEPAAVATSFTVVSTSLGRFSGSRCEAVAQQCNQAPRILDVGPGGERHTTGQRQHIVRGEAGT